MSKSPDKGKPAKPGAVQAEVLGGNVKQYEFKLGPSASMGGMYQKNFQNGETFTVFELEVAEDKRRQGIGSRCLQAAAVVAKEEGAKKLTAIVTSYSGLLLCEKLLGSTDVSLRHQTENDSITIDDGNARSILEGLEDSDSNPHEYVIFEAMLDGLDTSGWETPKVNSTEA